MYDKLKRYKNKKVLITGNTGFKGAWLAIFLKELGAKVIGYSDKIKWKNAIFDYKTIMNIEQIWGDIRDYKKLKKTVLETEPDFIFHLAAQPLVIEGLKNPFNTFTTNINGTLNLIDIVSNHFKNTSLVIVTSDKVYQNLNEKNKKFSEHHSLDGNCPYSLSKVICELLSRSYSNVIDDIKIRTVRGGNVIGGGDWSQNRLVPDLVKSYINKTTPVIRNPEHTRPWSYILDVIFGYLLVGIDIIGSNKKFDSYNIGAQSSENKTVLEVTEGFLKSLGKKDFTVIKKNKYIEKEFLSLDTKKIRTNLSWYTITDFNKVILQTSRWYKRVINNESPYLVTREFTENYCNQIFERKKIYA